MIVKPAHLTLIAVDKDATAAVHDEVSSATDFVVEIAMPGSIPQPARQAGHDV
jgi:hypothetical protein